ncbi:phospholipase D-like domain-containing protein [Lipingzhangella sp. LS1_29]|uniref:Phospholipase D-like domain-containing protein n=1 Tax=Lipingzhangella rawalii TaxID=2055835 RepID=A0ABU2HBG7_9ACTN|nr:phospholipase D-like domain-containing protein [Lipingzhangella rawalii]MDS1272626.1 phospholipase D-like domain-containing protein [Lipingzhangella rawalii]
MPRRIRLWRVVKRILVGLVITQLVALAGLVGLESWRKRIRPQRGHFPRTPPTELSAGDTDVTVYTYGDDLYRDMLSAIRTARRRVLFESFIVKGDEVGRQFKQELVAAAERGVDVYVIYDGFANLVVPPSFFWFPPSVRVLRYPALRPGALLLNIRKSGRDHRKILTVDGHTGFVGGYNIGSLYATKWRDTHLRLVGPSVWELENAFADFWNMHRSPNQPRIAAEGAAPWAPDIRAYRNVPEQLIYPIRAMYLEAIDRAKDHVLITQAYFVPDREFRDALIAAAQRGVNVRILVPESSNHVIPDWLSRGLYTQLLRGGVSIWLFRDAMIHAKTATIDGRWSTVGTANVDRLSLTGNYEINLEIFDEKVAAHLERVFASDTTNARPVSLAEWEQRSLIARLGEALVRPLRPLL